MSAEPIRRSLDGTGAAPNDDSSDSRTDAGVHPAGNIVSIKMITIIPGVRDIVARINEELPPEIRL
ncbi:hypothetical protein Clacol_005230 [Clathrus columnatus]|uniref:Uncharacterized protein n=1 Tax=Clathrus columnatus TaxID=1419009 RepID=A0AAV5AER0_9AGAM|nr:hypothetical protein Clacol_005230 [Clathrus columnatus]